MVIIQTAFDCDLCITPSRIDWISTYYIDECEIYREDDFSLTWPVIPPLVTYDYKEGPFIWD